MTIIQHLLVVLLVIAIPIWDHFETKRLKASTNPKSKVHSYQMGIATLWILAIFAYLAMPNKAGLFSLPESLMLTGEAADFFKGFGGTFAIALGVGSMVPIVLLRYVPKRSGMYRKQFESLAFFLPNTFQERLWFAGISLSAGFCEEIIYRAFLYQYFAESPWALAFWISLILACLVFAIAHGYQGMTGIVSTFFLALMMFVLWFSFGTLWIPIIVHAVFDLRILLLPDLTSKQLIES